MLLNNMLFTLILTVFLLQPSPAGAIEGNPAAQPSYLGGAAGFPERQPAKQFDPYAVSDDDARKKEEQEKPEVRDSDPYLPRTQEKEFNPEIFMQQGMMGSTPPAGMNPALKNYGMEQSVLAPPSDIMGPPPVSSQGVMIDETPPQPKDELTRKLHALEDEYLQALRDPSTPQERIRELEIEMDAVLKKTYLPEPRFDRKETKKK